jgi:NAD+ synthase
VTAPRSAEAQEASPAVPPPLDPEFTVRVLALALSQTLDDAARAGYVVGLSGGLDSALAAAIAVRAVGPASVHPLFMPGPHTSAASAGAARHVADHLGLALETVDLAPSLDAAPGLDGDPRRRGNFAARLRMALLYDHAARRDALVLGTGNKSEIALGYTTLWGDMAADVWPLGDLYKTQVLAIARAIGLPPAVIDRAPSAELWDGQTDEVELGFTYRVADRVLYYYLEERRRPAEIHDIETSAAEVERVLARVRSQAHKRRLPTVVKLSTRTIGHDFHHPRAWRGPA